MTSKGHVYLVGFGPGDPELLTLKGHRLLQKANVIFYDDLVDKEFLNNFECEKIYVGKRKGKHSMSQDDINIKLAEAAGIHACVVRLKGGDPFIFGRGGEELLYLHKQKIPVTIVPGVTASMAAAASVQIPLTMRKISKTLTFLPAHHIEYEFIEYPKEGTLVFYMGASKLQNLSEKLLEAGWNPQTSVALIQNASMPEEKTSLSQIQNMGQLNLPSPLVIIVGDVVDLKPEPLGST